jgi:hypothetical protein
MRLLTPNDATKFAESLRVYDDPQYGPQQIHLDHVEDEIRLRLARGDFRDLWSRVIIRVWLRGASKRRMERNASKPESVAIRSTIAAERAARYSILAVVVALAALFFTAWPYLWFNR